MRDTKSLFIPVIANSTGSVTLRFMESVIKSVGSIPFILATSEDSLVARARNVQVAAFLNTDKEFILFWDADIIASKQDLEWLHETDADILCGIYCKKMVSAEPQPVFNTLEQGVHITGNIEEIRRGGTGFMRIHRSVFETMKTPEIEYGNHGQKEWDFFQCGVRNGEYLSEDWMFSDNARALGFKIMLDTRIQLLHIGQTTFPIDWKSIGLVPESKLGEYLTHSPVEEAA